MIFHHKWKNQQVKTAKIAPIFLHLACSHYITYQKCVFTVRNTFFAIICGFFYQYMSE